MSLPITMLNSMSLCQEDKIWLIYNSAYFKFVIFMASAKDHFYTINIFSKAKDNNNYMHHSLNHKRLFFEVFSSEETIYIYYISVYTQTPVLSDLECVF